MNAKALRVLEYEKIKKMLAELAGSTLGREKCEALEPVSDIEEIKKRQSETAAALARLYRKGSLSFSGLPDVRASIKRLEVGSTLGAVELLRISSLLSATLRVKGYGNVEEFEDILSERFSLLEPLSNVANEIRRCIISEEEIADDASAGLKSVRRSIRIANDKIHDQLGSILNSADTRDMLRDALITMRNGRYCLPIKNEYKNRFQGMIHDQSSSGSTVFIEPMAIVKLNNELSELAIKEKEEIEKVLAELSTMSAAYTAEFLYNQRTLAELDFIFACAILAKQMKAIEPRFNDKKYVNIIQGRHPLIDPHKVVPIDVHIGKDFDLLIITGPNTGGKTVTLKTVGLFTLMGQSGLHIPAREGSQLAVFKEVYADIGDEQSIEQSLSTFSSHMTNTVSILKQADEDSLALFDELGAGTDPTEGAALAMAILSHLHERGIRTIATTHYSELKIYALSTDGVSNACCEFDVETLRPTYRLLIGVPGKSNAFAISSKLGLSDDIIEAASKLIGVQEKSFEDVIAGLEADRIIIEEEKKKTLALREEAERLKKKLDAQNDKLENRRAELLREANEQARDILQEAKDYADEVIKKFNKLGQSGKEMEEERNKLREKLGTHNAEVGVKKQKKAREASPDEYKVGTFVNILSMNMKGKISTPPNAKGEVTVQIGSMQTTVKLKDIEPDDEANAYEEHRERSMAGSIRVSKSLSISPEIKLIGLRVDEAISELDKYLDDAYLAHLPKVRVIHGRGTGALKAAVHNHLKRTKYVSEYHVGEFGEGDHGVTIVTFKK